MHLRGPAVISTDAVVARERFAYWREAVCDVFVRLDCARLGDRRGDAPFAGTIATRPLGTIQLSDIASLAQHVERTPRLIARAHEDDLLAVLQLEGSGIVRQDGRSATLAVGDFCLFDSVRPYPLHFDGGFRQLVLQFPRAALRERLGRIERYVALAVRSATPAGALTAAYLGALADERCRGLDAPMQERIAATTLDLLATSLAGVEERGAERGTRRAAALARAKMLALARLGDAGLGPAAIAGALGLAPRSLHRLFAGEGTSFMRWVLDQRLAACHRDLADPRQAGRSISDVALGHGFSDLAHFSRAFRRRYGTAPRDVRAGTTRAPR
jgi:AraC-like DNA-binding protein